MKLQELDIKKVDVKKMAPVEFEFISLVCETPPLAKERSFVTRYIGIYYMYTSQINELIEFRNKYFEKGGPIGIFEVTLRPFFRIITADRYLSTKRASFNKKTSEVVAQRLINEFVVGDGKVPIKQPTKFYVLFIESEPTIYLLDEYIINEMKTFGFIDKNANPVALLKNAYKDLPVLKVSTNFVVENK